MEHILCYCESFAFWYFYFRLRSRSHFSSLIHEKYERSESPKVEMVRMRSDALKYQKAKLSQYTVRNGVMYHLCLLYPGQNKRLFKSV